MLDDFLLWLSANQELHKNIVTALATVFTGTIGFFGVIATLLWNARQGRNADQRKWIAEREAKSIEHVHKRDVLRSAIRAELQSLVKMIKGEREHLQNGSFTWVPLLDFFAVYRSNMSDIGLLSPLQVEKITEAYHVYQERAGYIARMSGVDASNFSLGSNVEFNFHDSDTRNTGKKTGIIEHLQAIEASAQEAIDAIDSALSKERSHLEAKYT
jgi:hypothetical protein